MIQTLAEPMAQPQSSDIDRVQLLAGLGLGSTNLGVFNGTWFGIGTGRDVRTPIDGSVLGTVHEASADDYDNTVTAAHDAFRQWRTVPSPKRGEVVRQIGSEFRARKHDLGALVALEMGKIRTEGEGEVQEMIDICDFGVGLSRQLYGLTMHSERPGHRMYEQWHPLGIVGVISAFNFPVAVWAWNAVLAWVCGDAVLWKPSEKTPLCAIACTKIVAAVFERNGFNPALASLVCGEGPAVGELMAADKRIPLVSATGSTRMGQRVGRVVSQRLGRTILELGGNNAIIVSQHADLDLATRAIVFGAAGTCGQRCTTTRRVIVHESVFQSLRDRLISSYETLAIGNPLASDTLVGPLIDEDAVDNMFSALESLQGEGGEIIFGGERMEGVAYPGGCYVRPCLAIAEGSFSTVQRETFAPILYLIRYRDLEEAIAIHNSVPQGLSGAIFTQNLQEAEQFLSAVGSDCGIANVNIGTSGAEIGGAFGGEKETGGGRESGSDAWKAYMRRQTCTINYTSELPLAQGVQFG
jgi:aldehyde dehydrogenase (NAD+)